MQDTTAFYFTIISPTPPSFSFAYEVSLPILKAQRNWIADVYYALKQGVEHFVEFCKMLCCGPAVATMQPTSVLARPCSLFSLKMELDGQGRVEGRGNAHFSILLCFSAL